MASSSTTVSKPQHATEKERSASQGSEVSSTLSTTSTLLYRHEAFESYQYKVIQLCEQIWPGDAFILERISSGRNYRVIGITRTTIKIEPEQLRYVIRIPRFPEGTAGLENDIATAWLIDRTNEIIKTAGALTYDLTSDNAIGAPFAIEPRLLGISVDRLWVFLNNPQRISLARQLAHALLDLQRVNYPCAGRVRAPSALEISLSHTHLVQPHFLPFRTGASDLPATPVSNATHADFLLSQIQRWRTAPRTSRLDMGKWNMLAEVVRQMAYTNILDTDTTPQYRIVHRGMQPRDVLISVLDDEEVRIEGVLGWERGACLPGFVGCRPPDWLWRWESRAGEGEGCGEGVEQVEPDDADSRAVKDAFDEVVGESFCRYAYMPQYRLARSLVSLAIDGFGDDGEMEGAEGHRYDAVDGLVEAWNALMLEHGRGQGSRPEDGQVAKDGSRRRIVKRRIQDCASM